MTTLEFEPLSHTYEEREQLRADLEHLAGSLMGVTLAAAKVNMENDRLRAALTEQGFLQKKADGSMVWHAHDCPASFDFAQCNYRCRVARAALEGRE